MILEEIPEEVLGALRGRGRSDQEIHEMEPRQMFIEFCESVGLGNWGDMLYEIAYDLIELEVDRLADFDRESGEEKG